MKEKIIILFVTVTILFSCKSLQNNAAEFKNINKYLVCFNYTTKEICLINIKTGNIDKKYKMEMDILKGGAINDLEFSYDWFYKENDNNVYLLERSGYKRVTRIYEINIDTFEISEIFKTDTYYFRFFIENNNLYLMRFIEPSNGRQNLEQNYIILHNLLNKDETIINFNELLPENEKVRSSMFYIDENRIIFIGYNKIYHRKLFIYNTAENTIKIIDEYVRKFSINNDTILYTKDDVEETPDRIRHFGSYFVVYNLKDNIYRTLPHNIYSSYGLLEFIILNENTIIYTDDVYSPYTGPFDIYIFHSETDYEKHTDFYIAAIDKNKRKLFFSTDDDIMILGIKDKNRNRNQ